MPRMLEIGRADEYGIYQFLTVHLFVITTGYYIMLHFIFP